MQENPHRTKPPVMPTHTVSRILPWSCTQLFDLAADVEHYPDFIPGWNKVRILERDHNRLKVEQCLSLGPIQHCFISEALLERPQRVAVSSRHEPFRTLQIEWRFTPDNAASRLDLTIELAMAGAMLEAAPEMLFIMSADDIITRFEQRARQLYGTGQGESAK